MAKIILLDSITTATIWWMVTMPIVTKCDTRAHGLIRSLHTTLFPLLCIIDDGRELDIAHPKTP
jgi:hypothetical protein